MICEEFEDGTLMAQRGMRQAFEDQFKKRRHGGLQKMRWRMRCTKKNVPRCLRIWLPRVKGPRKLWQSSEEENEERQKACAGCQRKHSPRSKVAQVSVLCPCEGMNLELGSRKLSE